MRIYDNNYESIRSTFVMDDRDDYEFNPKSETFTDNAIAYALRRSFRDFNFRTLTAVKSDETIEFVSEFDKWVAKQREAKEAAQSKTEKKLLLKAVQIILWKNLKTPNFISALVIISTQTTHLRISANSTNGIMILANCFSKL